MFTNIGGKIKGLAKAVCWIGIILSVILGIVSIVSGSDLSERGYMQDGKAMATSGWTMLFVGPLLSWVGSFVLYGFGELIDRAVSIDEKLSAGINKDDIANPPVPAQEKVEEKAKPSVPAQEKGEEKAKPSAPAQEKVEEKAKPSAPAQEKGEEKAKPEAGLDILQKSSRSKGVNPEDIPHALAQLDEIYRSGSISKATYLNQKAKILGTEKE